MQKLTLENFINRSNKVHNNFYDYSQSEYIDCKTKIKIICPNHGEFLQTPDLHLQGAGCMKCSRDRTRTTQQEFVEQANTVHNNFYDYSQVDYKNSDTKIKIICPIHGEFFQTPVSHIQGHKCSKCSSEDKKTTQHEFEEKANKVHNNFYDYSQSEYIGTHEKIKIICPKHGEFFQKPEKHLRGIQCVRCSIENRTYTQQYFVEQANKVHNNFYDYSQSEYKNSYTRIKIICPKHGEFRQFPFHHLKGRKCSKCSVENRTCNQHDFIKKANKIHNNFYDYSQCEYINARKKVKIICPKHGEFFQIADLHLSGSKCKKCSYENNAFTQEDFEKSANTIHNSFYDYSQVIFINRVTKIKIICPKHGGFLQCPNNHLQGDGCIKCSKGDDFVVTQSDFIKKANKIHNNFYDYSQCEYINAHIKIKIVCPKHGRFLQSPNNHLSGHGCPKCYSSKGEEKIENYLKNDNIISIYQKTFNDCKGQRMNLRFDFYLPDYNICIEYDGMQHFIAIDFWGGKEMLEKSQIRDKIKTEYCLKNNIKLLRIPYTDFDRIEEILDSHLKKLSIDISKTSL